MQRIIFVTCLAACLLGVAGLARAGGKPIRIWNLTSATIVDLKLAPSGTKSFGRNLVKDDKDGEIDIDERLSVKDISPGLYDAKVALKGGRKCDVPRLELKDGEVASIEEKDLLNCVRH